MTGARLVYIGGRPYWAGLQWETLAPSEQPRERIKALAKEVGSDGLRCLRDKGREVVSVGYAYKPETAYKRAPSLALSIADARREPWMGLFDLGDGLWWYVAVREGQAVITGGDVVGTREEVEAARYEQQGLGDWNESIESGEDELLELLAEGRREQGRAEFVYPMRSRKPLYWGVAALVVACSTGGYLGIEHHIQVEQQRQARLARAHRIAAERAARQARQAALAKERPWAKRPRTWLLTTCQSNVDGLPLVRAGWQPTAVACQGSAASVIWQRLAFGRATDAPLGHLGAGGDKDIQVVHLNRPQGSQRSDQALTQEALRRAVFGQAQTYGLKVSIPKNHTSRLPGAGPAHKQPNKSPYRSMTFIMRAHQISDLEAIATAVPTTVISSVLVRGLPSQPIWRVKYEAWYRTAPAHKPAKQGKGG